MRKRSQPEASFSSSSSSKPQATDSSNDNIAKRSGLVWTVAFATFVYASYGVYYYQYEHMPPPLTAEQAGKRGFSELEAIKHVKALTQLGPHPVGSDALDHALQYVLAAAEKIRESKHWEADVEVDFFHAKSGANRLGTGVFKGTTLIYSDLSHIVLRILPKYASEAGENAILVSSHIDTVFAAEGAGDCSSCVAVMLELARAMSQWAHGFKNAVIFLFNTGEEEGLNGAHSFVTQHPWSSTIRVAVDLEAMGIGGKSTLFQAGPNLWAVENFAAVAKYPSGQIIAQDVFASGAFDTATDFQVYTEVAGLSGLDFAYTDRSAVYHTKNDKLDLLKPGSLQHLGENMLAFLLQTASSTSIPKGNAVEEEGKTVHGTAVYFDILGTYMVLYSQRFANMLHNSVIVQSLLIWTASLVMGGYPAAVSLALTCLSAILMLVFSISFSVVVAFILPQISSSPVPYVASPWLVVGLFAAPAFLGALTGQHLGYVILKAYLSNLYSKRMPLSPIVQADLIKLEAERWLFKSGFLQWLILLALGNYYKIGSTYMALVWLAPPAFAYGFLEATLTPACLPRPLKLATLLLGLAVPVLVSAGNFIRMANILVATLVRFDRNPGSTPEWLGNVILAVFMAVVLCLTLVYLLSYVHLSGAKGPIAVASFVLFGLSLILVLSGSTPPFSEDTARAVNVVHVVDASGKFGGKQEPSSYIALYSTTPGKLTKEVEQIKEGFVCGRDNAIDFVTSSMEYGCLTYDNSEEGWSQSDIPTIHVNSDTKGNENERITQISIDKKGSIRLTLAINAKEIEDFTFKGVCRASQVVELFSTVSPEIVVREARIEDIWEVAETHCSCFFPNYTFPLDLMLRVDRLVAMLSGFTVQHGTRRTCLVAVVGSSMDETFFLGSEDFKIRGLDGKFSLHRGYVAGILTVDTVADFLPRKGPLRQRRTGIAYISNVAVREKFRRMGIAKRLIAKAEAQARGWGCRSIALHCDLNNPGATKLYKGQGFKCIKVPEGANWPQPKNSPDVKFSFMMKLLKAPTTA